MPGLAATAHNTVSGVSEDGKALQLTHADGEATAPSPAGSDLWVSTENASGELKYNWTPPADGDWSLLLATDGTKPAPESITMTFPNDTSTPWAIPFMVLGGLLILAGVALLVLKPKSGTRPGPAAAVRGGDGSDGAFRLPPPPGQGRCHAGSLALRRERRQPSHGAPPALPRIEALPRRTPPSSSPPLRPPRRSACGAPERSWPC